MTRILLSATHDCAHVQCQFDGHALQVEALSRTFGNPCSNQVVNPAGAASSSVWCSPELSMPLLGAGWVTGG